MRKSNYRLIKVSLVFSLAILILAGLIYVFHSPLLRFSAELWIVRDLPTPNVDAIVVPGGGIETRPFGAADLYHEGISDKVVTFRTMSTPVEELGLRKRHHQANVDVLIGRDVPPNDIKIIGEGVSSSQDEVEAILEWCIEEEISSIVVVTEIFPSRRMAWAYKNKLSDFEIEVSIKAMDDHRYNADNWWLHEDGVTTFQNEILKNLYYRLRY